MTTATVRLPDSPGSSPKTSLFFGFLLAASAAYFFFWALGYTEHNHVFLLHGRRIYVC